MWAGIRNHQACGKGWRDSSRDIPAEEGEVGSRSRLYEGRFCAGTTVEVWGLIGEGTTRVAPTERRGMRTGG